MASRSLSLKSIARPIAEQLPVRLASRAKAFFDVLK
jgi:hypothetical protein